MHWSRDFLGIFIFALHGLLGEHCAAGGVSESTRSVWLVSNGFHSSLAFRARDFPEARTLTGDPRPDYLVIGWGAARFYQGRADPITLARAIFGCDSTALHVVPVRGPLARRFAHSAILRFDIPAERQRALVCELRRTFVRDAAGRPIFKSRGYFADSRFYLARDHFYFPRMCNLWVAQKLRHAGIHVPFFPSIAASELIYQAAPLAHREQYLRLPVDAF